MSPKGYQKYITQNFTNPDAYKFLYDLSREDKEEFKRFANLLNAFAGMNGEAGEGIDLLKKVIFHGHPFTQEVKDKLRREIGDSLFYAAWAAEELGEDLGEIMVENVDKLTTRFPNGFSTADSIARRDVNE